MFTAALLKIAKMQKQPECPLGDEHIKKMRYINTMEYYSVINPNGIISLAATWMAVGIISPEVKSDIYYMLSLICGI